MFLSPFDLFYLIGQPLLTFKVDYEVNEHTCTVSCKVNPIVTDDKMFFQWVESDCCNDYPDVLHCSVL